jgi:CelD/BcsL family acetyltransferase involved in cellulose biosynthesis
VNVVVARTLEEVEALRPAWERLEGGHVNSDIDFVLTHVRHAPQVIRPHVVLLENGDEPAGLVVARLENARVPMRLGYRTMLNPRVRSLTVVYGGVLAPDAKAEALIEAVRGSLEPKDADVVRIRMLTLGSPLYEAASRDVPFLRREHFRRPVPHWRATMPDSFDDFLMALSKERRRHVRRYGRRLEASAGGEVEVARLHSREGLEQLFADSAKVHRRTYQATLSVGFSRGDLNRRLTETCMQRGWFRGYVLYLRGAPVAFWHGNVYRGIFWGVATGFDPAYAEDRPGTYLLMRVVEDLCMDPSVHTLDFGFGDADYKRHFGDRTWLEEDVAVFEPTPRATAINLGLSASRGAVHTAQSLVRRTGGLPEARRRWRSRLVDRGPATLPP